MSFPVDFGVQHPAKAEAAEAAEALDSMLPVFLSVL